MKHGVRREYFDLAMNLSMLLTSILNRNPEGTNYYRTTMPSEYPPDLPPEQILSLISEIKDWQLNHGSLLKLIQSDTENSVLCRPVGVSVFPTLFPRSQFHRALDLQAIYNELYCAIAEDEQWIYETIKDLISVEPLAAVLWDIHEEVKRGGGYVQDVTAGIFRSDYMLQGSTLSNDKYGGTTSSSTNSFGLSLSEAKLKQVEFNAFSCAGGVHANKVVDMHRYFARSGAYRHDPIDSIHSSKNTNTGLSTSVDDNFSIDISKLPKNDNIERLTSCLEAAHLTYGPAKSQKATETAIIFVVQPYNFNVADERPLEYALWNRETRPIPTYRLDFGQDVLQFTTLTESRELLFHPPWLSTRRKKPEPVEISVVYMRAGYDTDEYGFSELDNYDVGRSARLRLEMSKAIKCPSVLSHISTLKKVQQALTEPGGVEHFLPQHKAVMIRETFVPMYPLDYSKADAGTGPNNGLYTLAQNLATNPQAAQNHILKPSLEGGGHNIFGTDIPTYLTEEVRRTDWSSFILMERIQPPNLSNVLMSPSGVGPGQVISELGVFGTCLWRKRSSSTKRNCGGGADGSCDCQGQVVGGLRMLRNETAGWSFKTKYASTDEMSVVKGYGCFDTPYLVD